MGLAHAISHLSDFSSSVKLKQMPLERACDHCQAFAQVGAALASDAQPYKANVGDAEVALSCVASVHLARTICVFQSRAPPAVNDRDTSF